MPSLTHIVRTAALAALVCLPAVPSQGQAGTTHEGYRGHGVQITYPSFLTVTENAPNAVSFTYENAGFSLIKVDSDDLAAAMTQMQSQMVERQFKVTSRTANQMEGVGENDWFLKTVAVQDHGATYFLCAFAPTQIYGLINQELADIQRTLVFDGVSIFGKGGHLTPSSGGCPGCAAAIISTMNNLTQHTAGH